MREPHLETSLVSINHHLTTTKNTTMPRNRSLRTHWFLSRVTYVPCHGSCPGCHFPSPLPSFVGFPVFGIAPLTICPCSRSASAKLVVRGRILMQPRTSETAVAVHVIIPRTRAKCVDTCHLLLCLDLSVQHTTEGPESSPYRPDITNHHWGGKIRHHLHVTAIRT